MFMYPIKMPLMVEGKGESEDEGRWKFLSSEYAISKQRAVKVDPGWASVKTDLTFTTE
jgi:hypothetical protein